MKKYKTPEILHEAPHYIVVNKPAGLIVERNPFESPTVEELVFDHLLKEKRKPFLGIVHRLDRVTSGVLLIAKKKSALKILNKQFADKNIQKTYLARVSERPPNDAGTLRDYLFKDQKNKKAEIFSRKTKDRSLVELDYEIVGEQKKGFLLKIVPKTGKYHQIRAQLAHIGCPIVGDEKYGGAFHERLKIDLHAATLAFNDPVSGRRMTLTAPHPFK